MSKEELLTEIERLANNAAHKTNDQSVQAIAACLHSSLGAMKANEEMPFMLHVTNFSINQAKRLRANQN